MTTLNLLKNLKTVSNSNAIKGGVTSAPIVSVTISAPIVSVTSVSLSNTALK